MSTRQSGDIYEETLAVFDGHEPLTTPEVAAALDAERRTVYKRLRKLVDRDELETKKTGSSSRVWWRGASASESGFPRGSSVASQSDDTLDEMENARQLRDARKFNEELVENAPFGMFRLDEELRITYENPRAEEIIGLPESKETSDGIGVAITELPPIIETGQAGLFESLPEGDPIEFEFPFQSIYGKEAYFTGRAVPVYRDGEFDGAILMATDISERRQYERELERQREQLAALDELNNVVRGITEAVIEQSTREEIEQVVCDRLAESDSYRFAWIGAVDANLELDTRVEAGIGGSPTELSLSPTPTAPTGQGPAEKAAETKDIQVIQNARDDPDFDLLGAHAREFDYRSSAVIPIVHQGALYGVLGVCSERPDAFAEAEREVIGQLGDIIGHAIAAIDRKRALMSDEVLELELRIPKLLQPQDIPTTDERITVERMTPLGDDEYLMYGWATADSMEMLHTLCEQHPDWTELRTFDETGSEIRFEQHLSGASIASVIVDHMGNFSEGWIDDGTFSATIQLPPGTDVRAVLEQIRETSPDAQVVRQQQVTRETPPPGDLLSILTEDLTERQRVAVEAGYFGGFFQCPRHRSGEEIADSLDIGASTFHQHVRKAERKLFDVVFSEL